MSRVVVAGTTLLRSDIPVRRMHQGQLPLMSRGHETLQFQLPFKLCRHRCQRDLSQQTIEDGQVHCVCGSPYERARARGNHVHG